MGFEQLANRHRLGQFQMRVQLLPLAGREVPQLPQPAGKGLFFHGDASFSEPSPLVYAFTTLNSDRAFFYALSFLLIACLAQIWHTGNLNGVYPEACRFNLWVPKKGAY